MPTNNRYITPETQSVNPLDTWDLINAVVYVSQFPSIQAAHDALPSTGGMIILAANTTYTGTAEITISKDNVTVWAPSWNTVLKRGAGMTGNVTVIRCTGANDSLSGFTVDGNLVTNGGFDIGLDGTGALGINLQAINGAGAGQIRVQGQNSRLTQSTVTGTGSTSAQVYGIGAHETTHRKIIDCNVVTATSIDGIGASGPGTLVLGNTVSGCHTYTGGGGGQIVIYANAGSDAGVRVIGNFVSGGGPNSQGFELYGSNVELIGNYIELSPTYSILLNSGSGFTITGNTIRNGSKTATIDGISVQAGVTDFVITGNRIIDDQGSPTMRFGIKVEAGASDRYVISGNLLSPGGRASDEIEDLGTGQNKTISTNVGVDNVLGSVASSGTIALPTNSVISLTGSAAVTSISTAKLWTGRQMKFIPNGAVTFTAGATIGNTYTAVANVPFGATWDGSKLYLG